MTTSNPFADPDYPIDYGITGQDISDRKSTIPPPVPIQQRLDSIDALVNSGREFYSRQKNSRGNYISVAVALQEAMDEVAPNGIIATMPYLIAGKSQADRSNYLWQNWFTALSEEDAGIDKNGKLVGRGQAVVLVVHGGGILTPERIRQAYSEGLTLQNAAKFKEEEFSSLLNGVLPSGESINLYTVDDVKRGIPVPFGRYAVWMPAETAKSKPSGYHKKSDFMSNELVIARAGTLKHLDAYFEKAKHLLDNDVGNWYKFGEIDFHHPQGRVLFVYDNFDGLDDNFNLNSSGRFVGVAQDALTAKK